MDVETQLRSGIAPVTVLADMLEECGKAFVGEMDDLDQDTIKRLSQELRGIDSVVNRAISTLNSISQSVGVPEICAAGHASISLGIVQVLEVEDDDEAS